MFLHRVWKHNRLLFVFMVLFVIGQLFVAYKRGMVFSPFYNYWMYASAYKDSDSLEVVSMYAGGAMLKGSDYSPRQWDRMLLTYDLASSSAGNRHLYGEIRRITGRLGKGWEPGPYLPAEEGYLNGAYLKNWEHMAEGITGKKVDSVRVDIYRWNGKKLERR